VVDKDVERLTFPKRTELGLGPLQQGDFAVERCAVAQAHEIFVHRTVVADYHLLLTDCQTLDRPQGLEYEFRAVEVEDANVS